MTQVPVSETNSEPSGSPEPLDCPAGPDAARFSHLKNFGYAEIFIVFGLAVRFSGWESIWTNFWVPGERALCAARLLLFVELVVLALRWIIATHHEFDMWVAWLENPFTKQEVYAAMLGLPIFLGLLLAFSHKIIFITGLMTVYHLVNYWSQWLCNDHFSSALQRTIRKDITKKRADVLKVMEYFWLNRPQLGRIAISLFFTSIAFSLALAGEVQQEPQRSHFHLSAYIILILLILISELWIALWRHKLDQGIRQAINP